MTNVSCKLVTVGTVKRITNSTWYYLLLFKLFTVTLTNKTTEAQAALLIAALENWFCCEKSQLSAIKLMMFLTILVSCLTEVFS